MSKGRKATLFVSVIAGAAFLVWWSWRTDSLWLQGNSVNGYSYAQAQTHAEGNRKAIVFFLHGSGFHRASRLRLEAAFLASAARPHLDAVVVVPTSHGQRWSVEKLSALIGHAQQLHGADRAVFVMGHSNGGYMAWQLAEKHSDRVAAIVPIAGGFYESSCGERPIPVWAIHGSNDTVLVPQMSIGMTERFRACGNPVRLTLLPAAGHGYSRRVLSRLGVFEWLSTLPYSTNARDAATK